MRYLLALDQATTSSRALLGIPVARTAITETTALGAAYLAGLASGSKASACCD